MRIIEVFEAIQGEGLHTGMPTIFVRLAGCNLRCKWCDTAYSYSGGEEMSVEDILGKMRNMSPSMVCVTGGEPLLQPEVVDLCKELLRCGYRVDIETNGSKLVSVLPRDVFVSLDIKCPSSGMHKKMDFANLMAMERVSGQIKFIIADKRDFNWAMRVVSEEGLTNNVIFAPVGGVKLAWLSEAVLKNGLNVRVMGQQHKVAYDPNRRGV